jgi:hypothetical protein
MKFIIKYGIVMKPVKKLQPLHTGPCLITRKLNDINYEIQLDRTATRKIFNHDKLQLYYGNQYLKWMKLVQNGK